MHRKYNIIRREPSVSKSEKKICLRQGSNQGPSAPYPTALSITPRGRNENFDEKKRVLLKLKWDADWALSPLPHAN